jgi:hypothetical protein
MKLLKTKNHKMLNTMIQWCHSTTNPIMGCGGCELFPNPSEILDKIDQKTGHQQGDGARRLIQRGEIRVCRKFRHPLVPIRKLKSSSKRRFN